jgi:hypothetical protein
MIKISQIKLPVGHSTKELEGKIRRELKLSSKENFSYEIRKRSLDARKKPDLFYVYTVYVSTKDEQRIIKKSHNNQISKVNEQPYILPEAGTKKLSHRPVIVGAGPAGLFAAYLLTNAGYAPLVLERGRNVEERTKDVALFWETGVLNPASNVQFGEGGAGTFSDGKLNTAVKDPSGRNRFVLETFVRFGAPENILYEAKPHIGTDILAKVILNMRRDMEENGAEFRFGTCVDELIFNNNKICAVVAKGEEILTENLILAIGHSARDTFVMLEKNKVPMEAKNFAVGFRVEHPQSMINDFMYGKDIKLKLPAAPYKVTSNFPNGRGVYSFCMCPGGYVVNASSKAGGTCVNGMSYSGRGGKNANSAIIVSVTPEDFGAGDALSGMRYQEELEQKNYKLGGGKIPQQLYGDYCNNIASTAYGNFESQTKGKTVFANLRGLMSPDMEKSFMQGMSHFSDIIPDFDRKDAILSGMETRTSSPVRILRNENCESEINGLYPCGEGAGYAGGIMSAAMDGLKVAEKLIRRN